jgi:hypothetical protein
MRTLRSLLLMLLVAVSTGAAADWVRLWENDVLGGYVDTGSVRKKGSNVMSRNMFDLKKASEYNGNEYRSSLLIFEFDCAKERARTLESIFHAEGKGEGTIVDSWSVPYDWHPVLPSTPLEAFMNYACEKK